jgi:hypothetical protein
MSVYAGQSARSDRTKRSPTSSRSAARRVNRTLVARLSREQGPIVPDGPCVGNDPASMTDSSCLAVLPMPTFGKSVAGYQVTVPRFLGATDDQHASPAGAVGLVRIPGSNNA